MYSLIIFIFLCNFSLTAVCPICNQHITRESFDSHFQYELQRIEQKQYNNKNEENTNTMENDEDSEENIDIGDDLAVPTRYVLQYQAILITAATAIIK